MTVDLTPRAAPMVPVRRVVVDVRRETADTVTVALADLDGVAPGVRPSPGQFLMLSAWGVGEVPISVSGLARPDGAIEHTVRAVGAATEALAALSAGDVVGVRGPFGRGWDLASAIDRDVVVVGGGIGLAPLRPVVQAILRDRERYGSLSVLVGARTPGDLCFVDDLAAWSTAPGVHVAVTVDRVAGAAGWGGPVGVVTALVGAAPFLPGAASAFVCGPEVMMRFAVRSLADHGVDDADVQVSLERSMSCGIGHCGHCQLGPVLVCRDGPVLGAVEARALLEVKER